jgi:hypothetical protein
MEVSVFMTCCASGFQPASTNLPQGAARIPTLALAPARTLAGRVVDKGGAPLGGGEQGAGVHLERPEKPEIRPARDAQPVRAAVLAAKDALRSIDGGASFQTVITLDSAELLQAVAADRTNPGTVYAATLYSASRAPTRWPDELRRLSAALSSSNAKLYLIDHTDAVLAGARRIRVSRARRQVLGQRTYNSCRSSEQS